MHVAPCTSPKKFTKLALGSRTFQVRAINELGNRDPSPARLAWTILAPAEISPPTKDFVLLGTFIAGTWRYAIVQVPSGELQRLAIGDTVDGFKLTEIDTQGVVFTRDSSMLELVLDFTTR